MWWKVYCKGCKLENLVHDSLGLKLTCMRLGCDQYLLKVEKVGKEVVDREFRKSCDHGRLNDTRNL